MWPTLYLMVVAMAFAIATDRETENGGRVMEFSDWNWPSFVYFSTFLKSCVLQILEV